MPDVKRLRDLSYQQFCDECLAPNEPALITGVQRGFESLQGGLEQLRKRYGDFTAPVLQCNDLGTVGYGAQTADMLVGDFIDKQLQHENGHESLYLKDWHVQKEAALIGTADYAPPNLFGDDWLNAWCDRRGSSDYRFVYIGGCSTWTPLHHDVLCSYSWSVNLAGCKHWILFPPSETHKLLDFQGELATDVREGSYDGARFPQLAGAVRYEVLQKENEAIFVPSGWHHQVMNLGDGSGGPTISVNHNWLNAHCLDRVWQFLFNEIQLARDAIAHERESMGEIEWHKHCAVVMKANCGSDFCDFLELMRVGLAYTGKHSPCPKTAVLHAQTQIASVLHAMLAADTVMAHLYVNESLDAGRACVIDLLQSVETQ